MNHDDGSRKFTSNPISLSQDAIWFDPEVFGTFLNQMT